MNDMTLRSRPASRSKGGSGLDGTPHAPHDRRAEAYDGALDIGVVGLPPRHRPRTTRTLILVLLAAVIGAGGVLGAQRLTGRDEVAASVPAPQAVPLPSGVGALGRVIPETRVRRLGPPSTVSVMRIAHLFVHQGEQVAADQVVADFADADLKDAAAVEAAEKVAEAQAALALVEAAGRPSQIAAQEAHIASLMAQQQITSLDAARSAALVPSGASARAVADRDRAAAQRADANLRQAEEDLTTLQRSRPEDVAVAEARLHMAQAALATARAQARLSRVYAPVTGTILQIYARPGDIVGSDGLLDMADLRQLDVLADVYQTDLPRVRMGASAEVTIPGEPQPYAARVVEIGNLVERTVEAGTDPVARVDGRTVEVRLALSPAGTAALRHRIDMQVQVAIQP